MPLSLNLDNLVDSTYASWDAKQKLMSMSRSEAIAASLDILIKQFKSSLQDVLTEEIQQALNLEFREDSYSMNICAFFEFAGMRWSIQPQAQNDEIYWQLNYKENRIICFPDNFQKQLLIEMGRAKAANVEITRPN